jgi:hypothetical protein
MLFIRETKKEFIIKRNKNRKIISSILDALNVFDKNAKLLSLEEAINSRDLIKKFWDALPGEHNAFHYESVEEMIREGEKFLPSDKKLQITLHLGWDVLSFSTTLEAAWKADSEIFELNTETYNSCIYPGSFEWYVIRAGRYLYPMNCLLNEKPQITTNEAKLETAVKI